MISDLRVVSPTDFALLDADAVGELLHCSARHVRRLADSGRMPRPVNVGALKRWRSGELNAWIAGGCEAPAENLARRRVRA